MNIKKIMNATHLILTYTFVITLIYVYYKAYTHGFKTLVDINSCGEANLEIVLIIIWIIISIIKFVNEVKK